MAKRSEGQAERRPKYTIEDWKEIVRRGGTRKVQSRADERTKVTYLNHLALTGRIGESCRLANISMETMRYLRIHDPEFAEMHEEAMETFRDSIDEEITTRAITGRERPVYQQGELVGYVVERSDRMLELLAKRHIPAYSETMTVNNNHSGGVMVIPQQAMNDREWEEQEGAKSRHEPSGS